MDEIKVDDIANELFILNRHTIETLFKLENCADCIALYTFFYKTAKWQETNTIKANEEYIKKSLGWGYDKIRRTKETLKEHGLIQMIQKRKDNKIDGWYIQVSYLVSQEKTDKIKTINNTQEQEVGKPTSRNEEINALKYNNICLKKEIEMLKNKNIELNNKILELEKQIKENVSNDTKEKNKNSKEKVHHKYGTYQRVLLTDDEYDRLCKEFGKDFIDEEITLLDEYVESNNNKNKYKNYNLVLRKAINNGWFKNQLKNKPTQPQTIIPKGFDLDHDKIEDKYQDVDLSELDVDFI